MAPFAPLPCTYVAMRINAPASVEEFRDPVVRAIAEKLHTKTYIALLTHMKQLPFFTLPAILYHASFVGPDLSPQEASKGISPDMCTPIFPATQHPCSRPPLQTSQPFPFGNAYHWSRFESTVRIRPQRMDQSAAVTLPPSEDLRLASCISEDTRKHDALLRAHSVACVIAAAHASSSAAPKSSVVAPPQHNFGRLLRPDEPYHRRRYASGSSRRRVSSYTQSTSSEVFSGTTRVRTDSIFDSGNNSSDADSSTSRATSRAATDSVRKVSAIDTYMTAVREAHTKDRPEEEAHTKVESKEEEFFPIVDVSFDLSQVGEIHDPRGYEDELWNLRRRLIAGAKQRKNVGLWITPDLPAAENDVAETHLEEMLARLHASDSRRTRARFPGVFKRLRSRGKEAVQRTIRFLRLNKLPGLRARGIARLPAT